MSFSTLRSSVRTSCARYESSLSLMGLKSPMEMGEWEKASIWVLRRDSLSALAPEIAWYHDKILTMVNAIVVEKCGLEEHGQPRSTKSLSTADLLVAMTVSSVGRPLEEPLKSPVDGVEAGGE